MLSKVLGSNSSELITVVNFIRICVALVFKSVFYAALQYLFVCVQPEHFVDRAGQRPRVMVAVIHAQCALELAENSALSND